MLPSNLHALDLPPLYTQPSNSRLLTVLAQLKVEPSSFSEGTSSHEPHISDHNDDNGIPAYLTRIVGSSLHWLDEESREEIWEAASKRLSERAGRTAAPSLTRTIAFPLEASSDTTTAVDQATINLHEPSLTSDNLGHKTWSSSYMLATHLADLREYLVEPHDASRMDVLELGAGTGLLGIAYALCIPYSDVLLTDLPSILPNLARNVETNISLVLDRYNDSSITAAALDWNDAPPLKEGKQAEHALKQYDMILCADPVYDPSHPELLVRCVKAYLSHEQHARFLLGVPLREAYVAQVQRLWDLLQRIGLHPFREGELEGTDDWIDRTGERVVVRVKWALWGWVLTQDGQEGGRRRTNGSVRWS